jgi:hypothetical protein
MFKMQWAAPERYGGFSSGMVILEWLTPTLLTKLQEIVEDLVQDVRSQEKELAEKNMLVADLQEKLACGGNFLLPLLLKV